MCATKSCASAISVPGSTLGDRNRPALVAMMIAVVEAFQEALAMRRAVQKSYLLNDE